VGKVSTICFVAAAIGIAFANGSSNAMKRLVYNRSGKSFRVLSRQLLREYRALYGQDENYWALPFFTSLLFRHGRIRTFSQV